MSIAKGDRTELFDMRMREARPPRPPHHHHVERALAADAFALDDRIEQFVPEFENAVFGAEPGDVVLVQTQFGWHVVEVKYGRRLEEAYARPGGDRLRAWIDAMPNEQYQSLFALDADELLGPLRRWPARTPPPLRRLRRQPLALQR